MPSVLAAIFMLFLCRLPSLNALDQYRQRRRWRRYLKAHVPSDDEIAWASERIDINTLREVLAHVYTRLMRNKVLLPFHGWRVAAIDGHEINHSYKRCCPECLKRTVKVNDQPCTQYYHRIVVLELLGEQFRLLLDAELLRPGEDEIAAAKRLLKRALRRFPRAFDILTGDALYAQAPVLNLLDVHGKYALMVLKDDRRDLLRDARALFEGQRPKHHRLGKKHCELWDIEGFTSWPQVKAPVVRVIRSRETLKRRERAGRKWFTNQYQSDWIWVCTLPQGILPTRTAVRFGHARWSIENHGFNELSESWHCDHYFHHHPISILAFWLIMFIAHAVFHCFYLRNLKPSPRQGHTVIYWAELIGACLRLDRWDAKPP